MEAATVAAFAVVAPLTLSGYAHLKDCLRTSSRRVGEAPRLFKDAFADPSNQLRIAESQGNKLGGHVTLSVDGQAAGSYLVFNGEILLVGDDPSHLQAVAAIGGARVTSQAHTVSVVAWEAPREMTLEFTSEQEAVVWANALREAAKLPRFPSRLDMLIEHIHMQDIHKKDLQVRVDKLARDHEDLLRDVQENTLKNKVAELEEKLREASLALDTHKSKTQAAEESLKEHLRLLKGQEGAVHDLKVGAVYCVDSTDPQHKADHAGLAYRLSMDLEDKDDEIAKWGTTVAGIDKGNGWVQVGNRYLPKVVGEQHVLKVLDPVAESFEEELAAAKSSLKAALIEKEEADERMRLLSRQVQDLKDTVAWAASATGRPDLLEVVAAAEANTLGASQEHAELLDAAEVRKSEIEEHARILEERLLSLEQRPHASAGQPVKQHLEQLEAAEEKHRLLSRQVQDIKEAVARTATAGGHQELLDVLAAAEANTLGASREHADMLESAEARKMELEERARILEGRLLRLEQPPEPLAEQPAKQDGSAGFDFDVDETADFAKMVEMAEAKRSQLEERAHELEMRIASYEQPQEHKRSVEHAALTARIQELQAHSSEKDRQIDEHLGRLEHQKREEVSSLAARLGQSEALLSEKEQQVEELLAELAMLKSSNGGVGALHGPSDESLQALLLHVAEAQGKATAQASEIHAAAESFEQHAKELDQLRNRDGAAPQEVPDAEAGHMESMRGELERLRMDTVAARQAAQAAEAEKQACIAQMTDMEVELRELRQSANIRESQAVQLQACSPELVQALERIAEVEARTRELQDAVEDKDRLVTELFTSVAEREQEIAKLQEALAQQPEVADGMSGHPDEVVQELEQRTLSAEARVEELGSLVEEKDLQAVQLSSTVTTLEQEVIRLRTALMPASNTEELLQRAADAEARAADLQAAYEDQEAEKVQLVAQVAAMEQELQQLESRVAGNEVQSRGFPQPGELEELTQRAVVAEARATEFEELAARSEDELAQLKATVAGSEQASHQRAVVAEQQLEDFHAITGERDQQFTQLREELKATKQELSHQAMTAASREAQLQAAATAAEQRVEQLKQHIELAEQEMVALRSNHADKADAFEAELQRFKEVETNSREAEALINERDGHILQLRQDMGGLEEELSQLRLQQAHAEEVAKQSLLKQTSVAQAHLRTVEETEAKAAHFAALADEKTNHIEQLQASTGQLLQELTQLRAAEAERAEMDKVGKQALLQEARAAEDIVRGQGFQESVDEVRAREEQRAQLFEEEKALLQRQLEAQFDVEYSAIQNQAAQVQKCLEASSLERDALLTQLEQVQAQESQRTKFFEEEKANLRRHLAEQFEAEYSAIQKKAADAERKLHETALERDAFKSSLQKAELAAAMRRDSPVKEQEAPTAVLQRLAASENAAEEARAKLQVAEQELIVACRTIEKQAQECGELQSQQQQEASAWEMQVAQLEQDRLSLQEQLAQRTMAYNRELEDVGVKMTLLEEALISAGGVAEAHTQARAELSPASTTSPKAADAKQGTPKSIDAALPRQLLGDGPPTPTQKTPLGQTIPIFQVTSPPQAYRMQETPSQVGATAPHAGFVGQVSQQPTFAVPFGSAPNVLSPPLQTVSPAPSYVAPVPTAPAVPVAAPLQNLLVPTGLVSPMQVRPQEPRGAAQPFGFAARPVQLVSPMVSPIRQRQDPAPPPPPLATVAVAAMQRGASPPLRRPAQSTLAPAVAAVPLNRASLTTATPVPASAVAPSRAGLQQSVMGSYSQRSRVETPGSDTSVRPVRPEGVRIGWSSMANYEPGSVGQVPVAKALRSESGSMLTSNLLQPHEPAHFQPAVAPSGGIVTSASPMPPTSSMSTESNMQSSLRPLSFDRVSLQRFDLPYSGSGMAHN